jgi:hypothetical protein
MNRLVTLAAASAVTALAFLPAVQTAQAAETGVQVTCGAMPGGGFIYNAKTLNSTPARTGPYEACSATRTYATGATVGIACWLYNDYKQPLVQDQQQHLRLQQSLQLDREEPRGLLRGLTSHRCGAPRCRTGPTDSC